MLALGAEIAREALAKTSGVVADAATGAVAALLVPVAHKDVGAGRTFLKGAVRSAEAKIAHTSDVLHGIPRLNICLFGLSSKLLLSVADTTGRTIVRAYGALATDAIIIVKALAFASLAVADTLVRAFYLWVRLVCSGSYRNPRSRLGAGTQRAVMLGPCRVAVRTLVADALVITGARTVPRTTIRTVCVSDSCECSKSEEDADHDGKCLALE